MSATDIAPADLPRHYAEVRARLWGKTPAAADPRRLLYLAAPRSPEEQAPVDYIVLEDGLEGEPLRVHSLTNAILIDVCARHGVEISDVIARRRNVAVNRAREEAYFRLSTEAGATLYQIGRRMRRDHSTVLHGIRKYKQRMQGLTAS